MTNQTITPQKISRFTTRIPPFPKAVQRVMTMLRDHSIQLTKVGEVVSLDQGLSGKVLRMANSAYFGLPRRVYNVTEALVLLGFANVRSVLVSASVGNFLCRELAAYGLGAGELWEHSVGAAYACQMLARRIDVRVYSMAFSAGLLHDVGKVAIDQVLDPDARVSLSREIEAAAESGGERKDPSARWRKVDEIETGIVGATHAEVGSKVCLQWRLPEEIVEGVGFQHNPWEAPSHPTIAALVAMADHCVNLLEGGCNVLSPADFTWVPHGIQRPDQALLDKLTEDLPEMISSSRQLLEGTTEVLGR